MARLVRHDATGPQEVKPQDKSVFICMCGLSQGLPFCDGSHKQARRGEESGKLYVYNRDRTQVIETTDDA